MQDDDFAWITKELANFQPAPSVPARLVSVLEGGYGITPKTQHSLATACCAHVGVLIEEGRLALAAGTAARKTRHSASSGAL
jgi:acetoin utilization deacetylase AcuC-like enzyme